MKRWVLLALVFVVILSASLFVLQRYLLVAPPVPRAGLMRTPNSAYKYQLCVEAFAFAHAAPDNRYKTDYTFKDPFRRADDTIIPHLLDYDGKTSTVNFTVDIIVNQVGTFHESISLVHVLDGISVLLPDAQNHLNHSSVPQFIIADLGGGRVAILDYTCPDQWKWQPNR